MNSLHIADCLNASVGGPSRSVSGLIKHLNQLEGNHQAIALDYPHWGSPPDLAELTLVQATPVTRCLGGVSPRLKRSILQYTKRDISVIHNHGCWLAANRYARKAAKSSALPLIISPRGMLETWALQFHSGKKRIAWNLFEKSNLRAASAFHATSQNEAESIRACGLTQPIYFIPNGVDLPSPSPPNPSSPPNSLKNIQGPYFLFLSRLHQKKGLDLLIDSWDRLQTRFPDWTLVIAGPDENHYWSDLQNKFPAISRKKQIVRLPEVHGDEKQSLLTHARFTILPSRSENFGIVIAESLAHGTPVLTTTETPWIQLPVRGCGWVTELHHLEATLVEALETPPEQLLTMGRHGQNWMKQEFSWQAIAAAMLAAYRHIIGAGPKPDFIIES